VTVNPNAFKTLLIVDLEATCCDQGTIDRNEMETIEIGAVMVEPDMFTIVDEFQRFVRPTRNNVLTPFCLELTSIQQSQVDQADLFPDVIVQFGHWLAHYPDHLFCSWGDYDRHQLSLDCKNHNVHNPMTQAHLNIKVQFSKAQGLRRRVGMATALHKIGAELKGTHHRGIDDARNMVCLLPYVFGRLVLNSAT